MIFPWQVAVIIALGVLAGISYWQGYSDGKQDAELDFLRQKVEDKNP